MQNESVYAAMKVVHILGVVMLVGNVTVTAVWKVFADRTANPVTIAFAQRIVVGTDWAFTGGGIALIVCGGYGMALAGGVDVFGARWLVEGQILFAVSGLAWAGVLLRLQAEQSRLARAFANGGVIPPRYRQLSRQWLWWGVAATVPLIAAVAVMVMKPL